MLFGGELKAYAGDLLSDSRYDTHLVACQSLGFRKMELSVLEPLGIGEMECSVLG